MGLLSGIKSMFGSDDRTFHYQCIACETEFESTEPVMADVSCPECGATRVRSIAAPTA